MARLSVLLVGKGPPDSGGISAMLTTLERRLEPHAQVDLMNLTRPNEYTAGVLSMFNLKRTLQDMVRLWKRARHYDVVHVHSAFVPAVTVVRAALLLAAAKLGRSRTVLHVHGGSLPAWAASPVKRLLLRMAMAGADAVVGVSDGITAALPGERPITVYNGVDTSMFGPGDRRNHVVPTVLFAGLLTRRKGVTDLMAASQILRERGVKHRLVLVGGRPDEGAAEEQVVREAAGPDDELIGPVPHDEIPVLLREADVFCLPSWYEAMPLSILEAMAAALPTVATRVGQIPDVVTPDVGLLVEPHDPPGLADALERLLTDTELRIHLGENARAEVLNEYSLDSTVARIVDVLKAVVSDQVPGRRPRSGPPDTSATP